MNFLKKIVSDTAIYGLSTIVSRFLNYILVPFHTAIFLNTGDFGTISEFYAYTAVLNVLFLYGMETAFFRFSNDEKFDKNHIKNTIQTMIFVSTFCFSILLFAFAPQISAWLQYENHADFVRIFAIILLTDTILAIPFAQLRLENKAKMFALLKSAAIVLNVFFNFFFLWFARGIYRQEFLEILAPLFSFYKPADEIYYVYLANAIANAFLLPFFLPFFKNFTLIFDFTLLKKMLIYALPVLITGLAYNLNEAMSRNLIKYCLPEDFYAGKSSLEALGIYSASFRLSIFITLAVQAFKFSAEPFFFKKAKDKDSKPVFAVVMRYFVVVLVLMYVGVGLNLDLLQYILRQAVYREGIAIVPILLLANIFLGIYYNLAVWYKVTDRTYFGAIINSLAVLVTLFGNLLLIPILGYTGSAISTLLCFGTMAVLCFFFGQKYHPIPYFLGNALFYLAASTVLIYALNSLHFEHIEMAIFVKNSAILAFMSLVFLYEKKMYPTISRSILVK